MPDNNQTNTSSSQMSAATQAAPFGTPAPVSSVPAPNDGIPTPAGNVPAPTASPAPAPAPDAPAPDTPAVDTAVVNAPAVDESADVAPAEVDDSDLISDIASRVTESHNILIALSSDPSVDEIAAAIGLSITLDHAGHRATAIYSGKTPNALEFLKPEDTFEPSADTLQDFVVAINKDKADHLRYKLDGDYVKIFITPYKSRIDEDDLEFSYGDFNIDLVLALNVVSGIDLDSALREHGRIMHDATIINITTGNPGKFGEIEWSNKTASSVSELAARLLLSMSRKLDIGADDATALLTGIVAATNHFSNAKTTPRSLEVASELLKLGANQQLISENLIGEIDNNLFSTSTRSTASGLGSLDTTSLDATSLDISHGSDEESTEPKSATSAEPAESTNGESSSPSLTPTSEASASSFALPTPSEFSMPTATDAAAPAAPGVPAADTLSSPADTPTLSTDKPEKIVAPSADFAANPDSASQNKYGQMLEAALAEATPATPVTPVASPAAVDAMLSGEQASATFAVPTATPAPSLAAPAESPFAPGDTSASIASGLNPAASIAPTVATEPEINGVPEMNFAAPADILPPPPAPAIDANLPPMPDVVPAELAAAPAPSLATPAAPASAPAASDAFQIPVAQ